MRTENKDKELTHRHFIGLRLTDVELDLLNQGAAYMTTMLRTFDHGKQYSIKLPIESTRYFLVYK